MQLVFLFEKSARDKICNLHGQNYDLEGVTHSIKDLIIWDQPFAGIEFNGTALEQLAHKYHLTINISDDALSRVNCTEETLPARIQNIIDTRLQRYFKPIPSISVQAAPTLAPK